MQYQTLVSGTTVIEFHNSWTGEETVTVNGQVVSQKSSVWGTNHYFSLVEDGETVSYILTTKVDGNMRVLLDLSRNGQLIQNDIPVPYGSKPASPHLNWKKRGLAKLEQYDLEDALADLGEAARLLPSDPELYFYMACAHSVLEQARDGFEALKKAVAHHLQDPERILRHDMLAFLRMHPAFAGFRDSGFREYDEEMIEETDGEG